MVNHSYLYHQWDWVREPRYVPATFCLTADIQKAFRQRTAFDVLIYGEKGEGKTDYAYWVLKQLYGDRWRDYMVFPPHEFLSLIERLDRTGERIPALLWDDAGLWLYALDYYDERVKSVVKLMNVNRDFVSTIILTTPSKDMIVKKLQSLEGMLWGRPKKNNPEDRWAREITFYKNFLFDRKRFVSRQGTDEFDVRMEPDDLKWYLPRHKAYLRAALLMMRKAYEKDTRYWDIIRAVEADIQTPLGAPPPSVAAIPQA